MKIYKPGAYDGMLEDESTTAHDDFGYVRAVEYSKLNTKYTKLDCLVGVIRLLTIEARQNLKVTDGNTADVENSLRAITELTEINEGKNEQ